MTYTGGAASIMGEESWKWLLLQPLAGRQLTDRAAGRRPVRTPQECV